MEEKKNLEELLKIYAPTVKIKYAVEKKKVVDEYKEGSGRLYSAGGDACDYCPHCYGTANWCPWLD